MRQKCRLRVFAAIVAVLVVSSWNTGCHIVVNVPPRGPNEPANSIGPDAAPGLMPPGTQPTGTPTAQAPSRDLTQCTYLPPATPPTSAPPAPMSAVPLVMPLSEPLTSALPQVNGPTAMPATSAVPMPQPENSQVKQCCFGGSCQGAGGGGMAMGPGSNGPIPRELDKVSLPDYIVEPPDILVIDTVRGTPQPPYRVEPLDALQVQVSEALPNEPISGIYVVEPEGTINLGLSYGSVPVVGMTVEQARVAIGTQLRRVLKEPKVVVTLAQSRGIQQLIRGEHLVRPDGTISLGIYGCVYVAGLNLCQVRLVIERYLSQYLLRPQVSLDVIGYNSKVYYVIFDGGGYGQQIYRLPITGNETVLDAISQVNGLPAVSSKKHIWLARPSPADSNCDQVLPVDWNAITQGGSTGTNYQILPGDRVYVKADPWICFDNNLAKVLAPFERMLGFTLLTEAVINNSRGNNGNGNGVGGVAVIP